MNIPQTTFVDIQFHNGYPTPDNKIERKRARVEKILQASSDPNEALTDDTCRVLMELLMLSGEDNKDNSCISLKRHASQVTAYVIDIKNKSEATRLWNGSHQKKWDRNHLSKILEAFYKQKEPGKDCWRFYFHEQFDKYITEQCNIEPKGDCYCLSFKSNQRAAVSSRQFKSTFKTRELIAPDDIGLLPYLRDIFMESFLHSYQKQKILEGSLEQLTSYLQYNFKKTEADFLKVDPNEKSHLIVCFLDESPIGFVEVHYPKLPFPGAYIAQFAVHPMWKAQGFGRILLEKARKCVRNETFFWGKIRKTNHRAMMFYNNISASAGTQMTYHDDDGNMPLADYPAEEYGTFKCYVPNNLSKSS